MRKFINRNRTITCRLCGFIAHRTNSKDGNLWWYECERCGARFVADG